MSPERHSAPPVPPRVSRPEIVPVRLRLEREHARARVLLTELVDLSELVLQGEPQAKSSLRSRLAGLAGVLEECQRIETEAVEPLAHAGVRHKSRAERLAAEAHARGERLRALLPPATVGTADAMRAARAFRSALPELLSDLDQQDRCLRELEFLA